jgi:hypothetical protein
MDNPLDVCHSHNPYSLQKLYQLISAHHVSFAAIVIFKGFHSSTSIVPNSKSGQALSKLSTHV